MMVDPTVADTAERKPFARSVRSSRPPVNAVFAGPLELSRLLFPTTGCTPVVCVSCQTINRQSALICKGCDGRLPAFFSSTGDSRPGDGAADGKPRRSLAGLGQAALAAMGHWRTVTLTAAAVLVLFAVFGIWYVSYLASTQPADNGGTVATGPADSAGHAPAMPAGTTFLQTALAVAASLDETPASESTRSPASAIADSDTQANERQTNGANTGGISRAAQARRVMANAANNVSARLRPSGDPLAACRSMGFFARAICMNDNCAQARLSRHPQCVEVIAQRRLDEARRNPVMVN